MRLSLSAIARAIATGAVLLTACSSFGAVYLPRSPATPGAPVADPSPTARRRTHRDHRRGSPERARRGDTPEGNGSFALLRTQRRYTWERTPLEVGFSQGRIVLDAHIRSTVDMPVGSLELPLDVRVVAEPVVSAEYKVKLQSLEVKVTSADRRLKVADQVAGIFDSIAGGSPPS